MIFSQPAFLWGLLAVTIPIAVHLLNFRRYRKVYFSNVERLSEMQTEQRRRNNLRQWLILAARVLAVVFLVLAFAQPVLPQRQQAVRTGSTAVSIYIDNSFSMEQASADGSVLDQARLKAREVADAYAASDRFQLLTNDMTGSQMRLLSRDELLAALDEVHPSAASPTMSTVARRQGDFLRQTTARNRHAYLISDFQRSAADLEALPADSTRLVTLVPLQGVAQDNVYIDTVVLDAPAYHAGGIVSVEATVRNSGSRNAEGVPLRLLVDGRERAVATLDVPTHGSATSTLRFTLDRTGNVAGTVLIEDYPVTFDDRYHFALRVGDPVDVLEIDGTAPNAAISRLFAADTLVHLTAARHLQHDLAHYGLVVLNEPDALASGDAQQLAQWVTEGGSLLVVPAEGGTAVADLNALLAALQAPRLDRWLTQPARATAVNTDATLYRGVFTAATDDMEMPSTQGHYALARTPHMAESLITLADGTPLLSVTAAGSGRLYLFTAPLRAEVSDLVAQALFVPTLYNMALYSRPLPPPAYTLGSPDPIVLQGDYDNRRTPPELHCPDGLSLIPDLRRVGHRQTLTLHGELTDDGLYTLADELLAFNHPRSESPMDFLGRQEIEKAIAGRTDLTLVRNAAKPLTDELRARDGGRRLWRLCLALALLMLATETLLIKLKR